MERKVALIACMSTLLTILTAMVLANTTWQRNRQPDNV